MSNKVVKDKLSYPKKTIQGSELLPPPLALFLSTNVSTRSDTRADLSPIYVQPITERTRITDAYDWLINKSPCLGLDRWINSGSRGRAHTCLTCVYRLSLVFFYIYIFYT